MRHRAELLDLEDVVAGYDEVDVLRGVSLRVRAGDVVSIIGAAPWTKVGVMMRASTQANSAQALMLVSGGRGLAFQRRTTTDGLSTHTSGGEGTAPRWVKLSRAGSLITASVSSTGGPGRSWGATRFRCRQRSWLASR